MDRLLVRQPHIEQRLTQRHLHESASVFVDVGGSNYEGGICPLMRFGYNRSGKRGKPRIICAVLTTPGGCPVTLQAYSGKTTDPNNFADQIVNLCGYFRLDRGVMNGGRGLLTQVRTVQPKRHPAFGWVSALRAVQTRALVENEALQLWLFDEQSLAGFAIPEYPGGRQTACYHREERRMRVCLFICLLAGCPEWHLHRAWAPALSDDEVSADVWRTCAPIVPAKPADRDRHKNGCRCTDDGPPLHSLDTSTAEIAVRCRNACRVLACDGPGFVPSHRADSGSTPRSTHHRNVPGIENP